MYRPGTTTTLAQPLHTGDMVVYLTNASSSWYDVAGASTHYRSFIFWATLTLQVSFGRPKHTARMLGIVTYIMVESELLIIQITRLH